jgi:hypothetical protein
MHRLVAPEQRPKLRAGQRGYRWHLPEPHQTGPFRRAAVRSLDQQRHAPLLQPFEGCLPPAHRLPGTPRQTDKIANPPLQAGLDSRAKVGGHVHRTTRGLCEGPTGCGTF